MFIHSGIVVGIRDKSLLMKIRKKIRKKIRIDATRKGYQKLI